MLKVGFFCKISISSPSNNAFLHSDPLNRLSIKMRLIKSVTAVVVLAVPTLATPIDLGSLGFTAMNNIFRTPPCAMKCIFDPHWQNTYAPECSDLSIGRELGIRLCQNHTYQQMIDECIKGKCDDDGRRSVRPFKRN